MESGRSSTEPRLEEREELGRKNKCRPLGKESLEWGGGGGGAGKTTPRFVGTGLRAGFRHQAAYCFVLYKNISLSHWQWLEGHR